MAGLKILRLGAVSLALGVALLACSSAVDHPQPSPPATVASSDPTNVIDFAGLPGIAIGASLRDLAAGGTVATAAPGCGPAFPSLRQATPFFDGDELVLLWAYPPLHTPEDVSVGSSVEDARAAYPSAVEVTPPAGSPQYPGLLVTGPDDLAYLMLHDKTRVQKLIVGKQKYARMLIDTGFGAC